MKKQSKLSLSTLLSSNTFDALGHGCEKVFKECIRQSSLYVVEYRKQGHTSPGILMPLALSCFQDSPTCSTGFKSRVPAGHLMRWILSFYNYAAIDLALCGPRFSYFNLKDTGPLCVLYTKGKIWLSIIIRYMRLSKEPTLPTRDLRTFKEKAP